MKLLPIILGTDNNSYSAAASYHAAYRAKALVCGSAILIPFKHSKIANIITEKGFSSDDDIFVRVLEKAYREYGAGKEGAIFFVPNEDYLFQIQENRDRLSFPVYLPYPDPETARMATFKQAFYKKMEELDIRVPRTLLARPSNYRDILSDLEPDQALFMKAADYSDFQYNGPDQIQKGYFEKNPFEAQKDLNYIYENNYQGDFIVQQYIDGNQGSEYSIMGYRSIKGRIRMVQARALLSDMRPKWVGNHLLLVDSHREDVYDLAGEMIEKLDYRGFFNIDIKEDSKGQLYILECNPRLGRSFYYANLAGVNFIKLALEDFEKASLEDFENGSSDESAKSTNRDPSGRQEGGKAFAWHVVSKEATLEHLSPAFRESFLDPARQENMGTSINYPGDRSFLRDNLLKKYQKELDERTFS